MAKFLTGLLIALGAVNMLTGSYAVAFGCFNVVGVIWMTEDADEDLDDSDELEVA